MGDSCQAVTEVIAIEDDEDEDLEVVFSTLSKTRVDHNLMCTKLSQEIELLQAMCKHSIPNDFNQFRELAKKLDFQISEQVIRSAWQRIMEKHHGRFNNLQNNKLRVICRARPLQSTFSSSLFQAYPALSSHYPIPVTSPFSPLPSSSLLNTSKAFPVALLLNQSVQDDPGLDNKHKSTNNNIVAESKSTSSQTEARHDGKKEAFSNKKVSQKRKKKTDTLNIELDQPILSKRGAEESDNTQNNLRSDLLQKYIDSLIPAPNITSVSKKVTRKSVKKLKSSVGPVDPPKTVKCGVAKSHVGVRAKIVKSKQTSLINSSKSLRKKIKEMSDAELKVFKAEQKRLKYEQICEIEMQQLQKVHDRLVDVLIPKYYSKDLTKKG